MPAGLVERPSLTFSYDDFTHIIDLQEVSLDVLFIESGIGLTESKGRIKPFSI